MRSHEMWCANVLIDKSKSTYIMYADNVIVWEANASILKINFRR
jgi:hypothetical protein